MWLPLSPGAPPSPAHHIHARSPPSAAPKPPVFLIVLSAVLGLALVLLSVFLAVAFLRRRRRTQRHFRTARLGDPHLTWDEYSKRRTMTRSRLCLEAEMQRTRMIRKSLQTRSPTPDDDDDGERSDPSASPSPISPPPRARSPEWLRWEDESGEKDCEVASGDDRWRLLNDGCWRLTRGARSGVRGESGTTPGSQPSLPLPMPLPARPKTPSLFSHPAFRGLRLGGQAV